MALVLFDLDGTLTRSNGVGSRAMTRAGRRLFGPRFSLAGMVVAGGLDPILYEEAARRAGMPEPHAWHDSFRDMYLDLLAAELAVHPGCIHTLPGVLELLDLLDGRQGVTIGLVTGNYRRGAMLKLMAAGIDTTRFRVAAFGGEAADRAALIALALARAARSGGGVVPADVIVVGDTPRDVHCARQNGCRVLAVTTGGYSEDELRAAGADVTAPDLADPRPLLDLLG